MKKTERADSPLCAEPDVSACDRPPLERLRFWNGRFMVARDLRHQQSDLIRRLEYHQKYAHGSGVLCGYRVKDHPNKECQPEWLVLGSGMAYDCCGRTLWMPEDTAVRLPFECNRREEWAGFLAIRRTDRPSDPMPALYSDDVCDPIRHEYGRIREDVEICVLDEVDDACWPCRDPLTADDCRGPVPDDCEVPLGDTRPCDCDCVCGDFVVLARLTWRPGFERVHVDSTHRVDLSPPRGLTRIDGTSWEHGGDMSAEDLLAAHCRLVVRFSRPLQPAVGMKTGINAATFTVSYMTQTGVLEQILPLDSEDLDEGEVRSPRLSENRRCAVFDIPRELLSGRTSIVGSLIWVKIRCDFLVDCHGRVVSGAHLKGDVNGRGSGNRVEGGTFESWFYIKRERSAEESKK